MEAVGVAGGQRNPEKGVDDPGESPLTPASHFPCCLVLLTVVAVLASTRGSARAGEAVAGDLDKRPLAVTSSGDATLEVPPTVTAGEVVEIRWRGIPADVEEVELLLSLDGGRSFHVRVSPELDGRTSGYRWRVPDLPTEGARLLLRVGDEAGERTGALSREFRILHAAGAPRTDLVFHEGEVWTGFEPMGGSAAASLAAEVPHLEETSEHAPGELPTPGLRAARPVPVRARLVEAGPVGPQQRPTLPATPREVPLRI